MIHANSLVTSLSNQVKELKRNLSTARKTIDAALLAEAEAKSARAHANEKLKEAEVGPEEGHFGVPMSRLYTWRTNVSLLTCDLKRDILSHISDPTHAGCTIRSTLNGMTYHYLFLSLGIILNSHEYEFRKM